MWLRAERLWLDHMSLINRLAACNLYKKQGRRITQPRLHILAEYLPLFFRSVFNEVHENSTEVWKWEMYRLVEEYDARPSLAPPLSVLEDFFELLKGIWKRTCRDASHQILIKWD